MNRIQKTALAMLNTFAELPDGAPVLASELRRSVAEQGANPKYIPDAAAELRRASVNLVATPARHLSNWRLYREASLDASDKDHLWSMRMTQGHYTEFRHMAQALYYAAMKSPAIEASRERVVRTCINLGADLGKSAAAVVTECMPERVGTIDPLDT